MLDYIVRYDGRQVNMGGHGALYDDLLEEEAGTFGSYSFTLAPDHPLADPANFATEDPAHEVTFSERYLDGEEAELFRGWVKKTSLDTDLMLTVECEGQLAYLKSTVARPYACRNLSDLPSDTEVIAGDPFEWLVDQHNLHCPANMQFQVGFNPHVGEVNAGTSWNSTWDEMQDKFCEGLDRYLHARSDGNGGRLLDLLDGGVGEGTQVIVLGESIVSMDVSGESSEIVTAIVPRASYDGSSSTKVEHRDFGIADADVGEIVGNASTISHEGDRMVNWAMVDAYGYREEKRDYEASSPEELAKMAADDLDPTGIYDRTANAIEVNAIDLHAANPLIQPIRLLEWDRVFVRAYGLDDRETGGRLILDQWMPCSKLHISSTHPEESWYRFGDLPQTMTRMSALRMGVLRRGDGTLVRRTDPTQWNNDRTWNHAQEVDQASKDRDDELHQEIVDATDQWSQHLEDQFDEATRQWYQSLDDAQKENAQGREEILKHLDEVEGKWSDEHGRLEGELGDLKDTVDTHHRELLEGIREAAEGAHRTFYGTCSSSGSAKTVTDLTTPGGETFTLGKGAVVEVKMAYASSSACTLNVASTGAHTVMTNGFSLGVWQAGQVVRFIYDGTYWQAASTDIYGATVRVGNPNGSSFYSNGKVAELQIDGTPYWHVGVDGQTVGLTSKGHVDIGSSYVDVIGNGSTTSRFRFGYSGSYATISSSAGMEVRSHDGGGGLIGLYQNGLGISSNGYLTLTARNGFQTAVNGGNARNVVMKSMHVTCNGRSYVNISASALGVGSTLGYAWTASNGDINANNTVVRGVSCATNGSSVTVSFPSEASGSMRINIFGIYVGDVSSDQPLPGPETFGDPGSGTGPSAVDNPSAESLGGEVA